MINFIPRDEAPYGPVTMGPFPFIQLTFDALRVGPDGIFLANYAQGAWSFDGEAIQKSNDVDGLGALAVSDIQERVFTDIVIGPVES